jgi:hypothetical protein
MAVRVIYLVLGLCERIEVDGVEVVTVNVEPGAVGMMPVFATLEDARNFSQERYNIVPLTPSGEKEDGNAEDDQARNPNEAP